jgi:hypothetical protein
MEKPLKDGFSLGVSKKTGEPKLENRETEKLETRVSVLVPIWKNQEPCTPVPVPGFWYLVFTGLPGTGNRVKYIFFIYF